MNSFLDLFSWPVAGNTLTPFCDGLLEGTWDTQMECSCPLCEITCFPLPASSLFCVTGNRDCLPFLHTHLLCALPALHWVYSVSFPPDLLSHNPVFKWKITTSLNKAEHENECWRTPSPPSLNSYLSFLCTAPSVLYRSVLVYSFSFFLFYFSFSVRKSCMRIVNFKWVVLGGNK